MKLIIAVLLSTFTFLSFSQDAKLLTKIPEVKQEFIDTEPNVIATINWLENTPFDVDKNERKEQNAFLLGWLTGSPTVTIEISSLVLELTKVHPEMLMIFMGGWTKYALTHDYSKDKLQGNLAGIRSCIKVYQNGDLKKDKKILKLIELEENGALEKWVSDQL